VIFNPHLSITLTWGGRKEFADKATDPNWQKWRQSDPLVAHWYNGERFDRLVAATVAHDQDRGRQTLVREFVSGFKGMTRSGAQKAVLDRMDLHRMPLATLFSEKRQDRLLTVLRLATKPSKPVELGVIGRDHLEDEFIRYGARAESFKYAKVTGIAYDVPWVIEAAFAWCPDNTHGRIAVTGCNWTPSLGETFASLSAELEYLRVHGGDPVMVAAHLVYPAATFTDKGKTRLALPLEIKTAVTDAITKITAAWTKQRKAEDRNSAALARREARLARKRSVSVVDAAAEVMEQAYLKASAQGTLPANARQVMYAARLHIQEATGQPLVGAYFTQTVLPNFVRKNPKLTAGWDIVYDDRGHLTEPHTDRIMGLGTLAVRKYLKDCQEPTIKPVSVKDAHVETLGPKGRYGALLYVEKEGFQPLFEAVQLAERFDIAIMSSKGMTVVAARKLAEATCHRYKIRLFTLHDFDKAGMSIVASFKRDNRRHKFTEKFKVTDLGFRLTDVRDEKLLDFAESAPAGKSRPEARAANMRKNGATEEEIEFLLRQRVELNALPSDRFVAFVERKLAEHGVRKIVPSQTLLRQTYRAIVHGDRAKPGIEAAIAEAAKTRIDVPTDLRERVTAYLEANPHCPWDVAVAKIVQGEKS
jgi:hypothetical protein